MGAKSGNTLILNATVEQAAAMLCDGAFALTLGFRYMKQVSTGGSLWFYFDHGVTLTSWGETITIGLTPVQPGMIRVDIESKCDMPTQIIDWGQNKDNVTMICMYINQNIGRYPQQGTSYSPPPPPPTPGPAAGRKFCGKCGAQLQAADRFCSRCGAAQA